MDVCPTGFTAPPEGEMVLLSDRQGGEIHRKYYSSPEKKVDKQTATFLFVLVCVTFLLM